jgi:hypothetical protein
VEQVNQQPAQPAEERTMPCGNCGGSDHNARTCKREKKAETKPEKPTLPARPARAPKDNPVGRLVVALGKAAVAGKGEASPFDLETLSTWDPPQLRALKIRVDEVLRAKLAALEAEAQAVRDALGEAA